MHDSAGSTRRSGVVDGPERPAGAGEEPGVRFAPDGLLIREALIRLQGGPCETGDLAAEVLGIRGGPPQIAERLVTELLRRQSEVSRGADGLWRLSTVRKAPADRSEQALGRLRYAVVDVETTGGIAGRGGRIIEIAIVHVDRGAIVDSFSSLVDAGVTVPPWITRLTGIRTEMIQGAPPFSEIVGEVRKRLGGRVFVAHSAGYDWGFVRAEMQRAGAASPHGPRLCTVHLARRLLPGLERRTLDAVTRYYGVEIHGRHRAQGDAVATAQVLTRMLADAERRGWTTWPALRRALAQTPPRRKKASWGGP